MDEIICWRYIVSERRTHQELVCFRLFDMKGRVFGKNDISELYCRYLFLSRTRRERLQRIILSVFILITCSEERYQRIILSVFILITCSEEKTSANYIVSIYSYHMFGKKDVSELYCLILVCLFLLGLTTKDYEEQNIVLCECQGAWA